MRGGTWRKGRRSKGCGQGVLYERRIQEKKRKSQQWVICVCRTDSKVSNHGETLRDRSGWAQCRAFTEDFIFISPQRPLSLSLLTSSVSYNPCAMDTARVYLSLKPSWTQHASPQSLPPGQQLYFSLQHSSIFWSYDFSYSFKLLL